MNALSIAAQLGLSPLPAKTATGRKHVPDGCLTVKSGGPIAEVRQKAADRRDYIVSELILSGPMTGAEIAEFTGANANTSAEDLKVLIEGGRIKKRQHKGENIYWVPQ